MTESDIAAMELRIQSVCPVRTVLRQEAPRPSKGSVELKCVYCSRSFWTNPYRVKLNTRYCSKACADRRKHK